MFLVIVGDEIQYYYLFFYEFGNVEFSVYVFCILFFVFCSDDFGFYGIVCIYWDNEFI